MKPDLVIEAKIDGVVTNYILDTKWKYQKDTTTEDVRQMYAYGHYFKTDKSYLVYPDKVLTPEKVLLRTGDFYSPSYPKEFIEQKCGLIWVDLVDGGNLNKGIGAQILNELTSEKK